MRRERGTRGDVLAGSARGHAWNPEQTIPSFFAFVFCLVRFVLGISPSLSPSSSSVSFPSLFLSRMLRASYLRPPSLYTRSGLFLSLLLLLSFFRLGARSACVRGPRSFSGVVSAATRSPHLGRHRGTISAPGPPLQRRPIVSLGCRYLRSSGRHKSARPEKLAAQSK